MLKWLQPVNWQQPFQREIAATTGSSHSVLAPLSRRGIGELIVYPGIRRLSVRRLSTFSNDISSDVEKPFLFIFHIKHLKSGKRITVLVFFGRIRTLVAMATYSSLRLVWEKRKLTFFSAQWGYFNRYTY